MRMRSRFPKLLLSLFAFGSMGIIPTAAHASSPAVPFQDQYVDGALTLCNHNWQPVTSGSLASKPFVWSAVSSIPAPHGYTRAYLGVYQPIQYVDPSNWAGYQLTDEALFSNPAHPIAQATYADAPLLWADRSYPAYWDGFLELRMYFSNPNESPYSSSYPAAVIHVSGSTWTLATGGGGSCHVGTAVSIESLMLPKSELAAPQSPTVAHPAAASGTAGTQAKGTSKAGAAVQKTTTSSTVPSASASGKSATAEAAGSSSKSGSGGLSAGILAAIVVIVVAAVAGAVWWLVRRRRRLSVS